MTRCVCVSLRASYSATTDADSLWDILVRNNLRGTTVIFTLWGILVLTDRLPTVTKPLYVASQDIAARYNPEGEHQELD